MFNTLSTVMYKCKQHSKYNAVQLYIKTHKHLDMK